MPGHGLGGVDLAGESSDRLQGGQLGPPGGGRQPVQVGVDRVAEVIEGRQPFGLQLDQIEDPAVEVSWLDDHQLASARTTTAVP